jgi:uncharacterized lipoprotein YbaY
MTRLLFAACLTLSSTFAATADAATVSAASTLAATAAPGAAATYRVEAPQSLKVKKGARASARVSVVPRADSHVSPDAPVSVAVSATSSIDVPQAKLGRAEAKATAQKGVAFDIPFVANAVGPGTVDANLVFFICTEALCERHKEHVQLAVLAE